MGKILRVGAVMILSVLLLSLGVCAKESKGESSALINLQLENISQSQGREQAQKMLLESLSFVPGEGNTAPSVQSAGLGEAAVSPMAASSVQSRTAEGGIEFSLAGVAAFAALALLLVIIIYVGLVFWRRSEKAPVRPVAPAKRFSLD